MNYVYHEWPAIEKALRSKRTCLFLDFDGTVTPIRGRPGDVRVDRRTKAVLHALARRADTMVCFVSGRSVDDLQRLVGMNDVWYAGNHGFEIVGPGLMHRSFVSARDIKAVRGAAELVQRGCRNIPGVLIQDKRITVSVHYRLADFAGAAAVARMIQTTIAPLARKNLVALHKGKKVYEIAPARQWNKGAVVRWFLRHFKMTARTAAVIFIGDDRTDEDAFKVVRRTGWGIRVGRKRLSTAAYYVRNCDEVVAFLRKVVAT